MKKIFFVSIIVFQGILLFAQEFQVPTNYNLVKVEDYATYEQDIINCVNWLAKNPVDQNIEKRKAANTFLMKWITGSPSVKIELRQEIVTFMSNPDILMAFLGGWAKYSLETKDVSDQLKGNLAGLENAILVYNKNKNVIGKDKNIEKYIKLQSKGKLETEIAKRLAQ
ncbi:MAG: hypothetical protein LBQ60_07625 [Bacteroidales bacterium]|jgi:hypothetical protein|nr:hypothetical protein [Bacteroidales bacterium]